MTQTVGASALVPVRAAVRGRHIRSPRHPPAVLGGVSAAVGLCIRQRRSLYLPQIGRRPGASATKCRSVGDFLEVSKFYPPCVCLSQASAGPTPADDECPVVDMDIQMTDHPISSPLFCSLLPALTPLLPLDRAPT